MKNLRDEYPEQFAGPYYLGTSVGEGWLPVVERALDRVRKELTPEELAAFHWVQIKEKFGRLCMYWNSDTIPVSFIGKNGISTLSMAMKNGSDAPALEDEKPDSESAPIPAADMIRASICRKIDAIVESAEHETARTCEHCGQPGRLYSEGYWATLCDEHAEGRLFPPVYGAWLDARDHHSIGSGADRIRTERVMYFRGVALYSWCSKGGFENDYVLIEDIPEWLADLVRVEKVVEARFRGERACLAEDVGRLFSAHLEELREQTRLELPDRARIDPVQAFAFEAARALGVGRVEIEHLVQPRSIAIAGVRVPDGGFRVFKQEYGEIREVDDYPEIFLERRAKEFEKLAANLRAMLRTLQEINE